MSQVNKIFKGFAWSAMDRLSIQVVQFVIGIILTRILTPEEYGTVGILIVFITISNVFIDSGFTQALIQKQDRTQKDISTVFLFNIAISLICYIILWLISPIIQKFYNIEELSTLLKVLSLSLIINALVTIPITLLTINLDFKTLAKANFSSSIISGIIAIILAYNNYGIWALVSQTLLKSTIMGIAIWLYTKWKPLWVFSRSSFKKMFSYGSNILIGSLLNTTVNNLSSLFIGKVISPKDLGYYTRGTQFSDFTFGLINGIIGRVLLPGLAGIQDDRELLISKTRTIIKTTALIVVPVFFFLTIMARPLIVYLLTEKWLIAVPIMQFFCLARLITILSGINVNLLYVIGKTNLALRQQFVKIIVRVALILVFINYGIVYVAMAELLSTIIHFFINTYYPGKIMNYGALKQIKDNSAIFFCGLLMSAAVYFSTIYIENNLYKLIVGSGIALSSYYSFVKILKIPEFRFLINQVKTFTSKSE